MDETAPVATDEQRPKTETEKFNEMRAFYVFRARQIVEIMRSAKDVLYDQMIRIGKCENYAELNQEQFDLQSGVADVCNIIHRFNAGILRTEEQQVNNIEVVKG
ncbi:hypothetical protein KGP36_01710 [Patescibacteria group bacterium]|nr:hypothetical protein [Patescibacteria group bacterium]